MSLLQVLAIFAAGVAAGTINTVVGSGTLLTFPVLLGFGYPPVVANVSNTVGLVPGSLTGAIGYRRELSGQRHRVLTFATASVTGGVAGSLLLLELPASAFKTIVPAFIAVALVLIILQPRISARLAAHHARRGTRRATHPGPGTMLGVFTSGIYGGYFGAAQSILLLSVLALGIEDDLQRLNALKVVLTGLVNVVSALIFVAVAHVAWGAASLVAGGSILGGVLGARVGRRLPAPILRIAVVVIGVAAIVQLVQ